MFSVVLAILLIVKAEILHLHAFAAATALILVEAFGKKAQGARRK
ncbi:MAG: hypothetical protein OXN84_18805 [Albidovulum sp.]|nr:hypothetical protein [Albidovulum sp.]